MKRFVFKILICIALVGAILAAFCSVVYGLTGGKYARLSYQKGFVYQVRALENKRCGAGPKVLLMGGSYLPFGVNMPLLRKLLGCPAYSLGIHAAMGESYVFETARRFVNRGDTIVYIFEPVRSGDYGMPLIYQTMDGESDLMLDFILHHPILFACTFPDECAHRFHEIALWKLNLGKYRPFQWEGIYHERAFDRNTGDMTYPRECKYVSGIQKPNKSFLPQSVPDETIDILNEFSEHCARRGARFVIAFPPFIDEVVIPDERSRLAVMKSYESFLASKLSAPVIAHQYEQIYPIDMMYDRPQHLTDRGAADYTRRLARDIRAFMTGVER